MTNLSGNMAILSYRDNVVNVTFFDEMADTIFISFSYLDENYDSVSVHFESEAYHLESAMRERNPELTVSIRPVVYDPKSDTVEIN